MKWKLIPADGPCAALSVSGPFVISHRPERFTVSYRPEEGGRSHHFHVGVYVTLEAAKAGADAYAETPPDLDQCKCHERGVGCEAPPRGRTEKRKKV